MKLKDGTTKPFEPGDPVLYIPKDLLVGDKTKMVNLDNLGYVTSTNDKYVFVRYINNTIPQATNPNDLYFIHNQPDLKAVLEKHSEE